MLHWRISVYDAALTGDGLDLPEGPARFIYAAREGATLHDEAGTESLRPDSGRFCRGPAHLSGQGTVWVFEGGPGALFLAGPGVSLVLSRPIAIDAPGPRLIRADRIESPSGSATPRHGHRGPGIRRLLYGRMLGEIGDSFERIDPGHAWFETGTDPVIGTNIHTGDSAFVRVMVLPPELQGGKTSFVATDGSRTLRPPTIRNRIFEEILLECP